MPDLYISEVKYLGGASQDFIEIAVAAGTDVSNIQVVVYNQNGSVRSINDLGSIVTTVDGIDVYLIDTATSPTFNGLHQRGGVALMDDGAVDSFISFDPGAPIVADAGTPAAGFTSTEIGSAGAGESLETTDGGVTYTTQTTPSGGTIPCFTPGTFIATPTGNRLIENLKIGDLIITKDNGLQAIRWIGKKEITGARLYACPQLRPVRIKKNTFGNQRPYRDLVVSPQHRIVINNDMANILFGSQQVLVPAKALVDEHKVDMSDVRETTYIHILFDHHEIIYANGVATESFHPNKAILNSLDQVVQDEIYEIFPELHTKRNASGYGPTALPALSVSEGQNLAQKLWRSNVKRYKSTPNKTLAAIN
jgi:hypothetical protein